MPESRRGKQFLKGGFARGAEDAITAFAGGGQASARQLTKAFNRITTVATAGDSVKLPASQVGLEIIVVNNGANPCQVFGLGTDTINGVASGTGVSQMQNSIVIYVCEVLGLWQAVGLGNGYSSGFPTLSYTNGITAFAGGGQGSAVPLTTVLNRITTVGTAADSVKLPPAKAGMFISVANAAAANSANVFPSTGDNINALAANAAFALAANKTVDFVCMVDGTWHGVLTA